MKGKDNPGIIKHETGSLNEDLRFRGIWRIIAFMNIGIIIILSVVPGPEDMGQIIGLDKLMHVFAYTFTMFWCNMCYPEKKYIMLFSAGLILMGIALEIIQGLTEYRMMSSYDMIANSIGVFLGWLLARTRLSMLLSYVEKRFLIS